ncbi:DUF397 domain-containing protein [Streptomyces sp. TRM68367]|uniref:DUF397 domain-containing protein n=1 Tax=Streptomyces sp. TRM68367 TaxID=2758415 RepID=UPI00165BDB30|nr:DUF397 domain-containing protein [Streptomyces sp. TRM68367]MBC9725218.1 DUF397 domain-containing protein [Streptomyces sp. TRM68367]
MPQLTWQKSSFSGGGESECVELATAGPDRIHLRESDHPHEIATTTASTLSALLSTIKGGGVNRP